jgi:subtilisin-like proprotein convertase family protein
VSWKLDLKTLAAPPSTATVSASNTTAVPIPNTTTISSNIVVSGAMNTIGAVKLNTNITHTASNNLDITLRSPSGTVVTITTDNGGTNDDNYKGTNWFDKADPGSQIPYTTANSATDFLY